MRLRRRDIRYGNVWVRVLCCTAVFVAAANAVHFRVLDAWEATAHELLGRAVPPSWAPAWRGAEFAFLLALCLAPALLKIERPILMVACGFGFAAVYGLVLAAAAGSLGVIPPIVSPLLGLAGSTLVLETMAWSEERGRRRALERLEAAKQQFTDMLVHDLRRRVSSIQMSASLLERELGERPEKVAELLGMIRATTERMLVEASDLLDIRRIQEGKLPLQRESVSLRRLLTDTIEELQPAGRLSGVGMRLAADGETTVRVDPGIFRRILANLVWNALLHAPSGSDVELECGTGPGGQAHVRVANGGRPIPDERQALLFEAFSAGATASGDVTSGAGLGLAFCKLAVEAHAGSIRLQSPRVGHPDGVSVTVTLPASAPMQP
jgi:signal transduction histidine kinase